MLLLRKGVYPYEYMDSCESYQMLKLCYQIKNNFIVIMI